MILELPKELTVARAAELKALLLSALDGPGPLELGTGSVAEVDVAGLQILCAAGRTARARGNTVSLARAGRSQALVRAIAMAGFGCGPDDAWLGEEKDHG